MDAEPARSGLAPLLSTWGYEIEAAVHGNDALDRAGRFEPWVVIAGMLLPGFRRASGDEPGHAGSWSATERAPKPAAADAVSPLDTTLEQGEREPSSLPRAPPAAGHPRAWSRAHAAAPG
jgi:hypothetical protein